MVVVRNHLLEQNNTNKIVNGCEGVKVSLSKSSWWRTASAATLYYFHWNAFPILFWYVLVKT